MEEQQPITPGEAKGCLLRGCVVSVVVLLVLAAVILVSAYSRQAGSALVLTAGREELLRVKAIVDSFEAFRTQTRRYPVSFEEWHIFDENAGRLLETGTQSVEPRYRIRWDAWNDASRIVLMSPDHDFSDSPFFMLRSDKRGAQQDADMQGACRYVVFGDGRWTHSMDADWDKKREFAEWAGWSFKEEPPKK
jgi:hypothetical protein